MPRAMHFGPEEASSIDLCVHDFVTHSRYRDSTTVIADTVPVPYDDCTISFVPEPFSRHNLVRQLWLWRRLRAMKADLVVVQQHLPTAAMLARLMPDVPVLLHAHNFLKPRTGDGDGGDRRFGRLAGLICVSATVEAAFRRDFPSIRIPAWTIHNGLDMAGWAPAATRAPLILLVARAAPFKGVMEAVEAMLAVLPYHPEWRARVMLSNADDPAFHAAVLARVAQAAQPRLDIAWQQPFRTVKHWSEQAAIALVPSIWLEPYGRTALEAHAGGAALISSGRGGLREISGEAAAYVEEITPASLAAAISGLITAPAACAALAEAGRRRAVESFDIRIVSSRLDDVYAEAMQAAAGK